jgi:hypothetical protein
MLLAGAISPRQHARAGRGRGRGPKGARKQGGLSYTLQQTRWGLAGYAGDWHLSKEHGLLCLPACLASPQITG